MTRLETTVWLPTRAEPGPLGWSTRPRRSIHIAYPVAGDPDATGPVVDGGGIGVQCSIEDGRLFFATTYVPAEYPDRLPEEMSCAVGRFEVHARVLTKQPLYDDPSELQVDPERGAEVRRHSFQRGATMYVDHTTFALSEDVSWATVDAVPAYRGRRPWADTTCAVSAGEPALLTVGHTSRARRDGWGRCELPDEAGTLHTVRLRLVTVER